MKRASSRVLSQAEAAALAERVRASGGRVVFTNGVFDLLHPGHIRYLQEARSLGEALVVAVNSDRSVRSYKALDRPINPEAERAELIASLSCVDGAVIFDEDTPHAIISLLQPDVLVKGADWGPDNIVGRDVVESRGGQVIRVELAPGHSTSDLIDRVRRLRMRE